MNLASLRGNGALTLSTQGPSQESILKAQRESAMLRRANGQRGHPVKSSMSTGSWFVSVLAFGGFLLAACAGGQTKGECPKKETVSLTFDTHTELNHDRDGYSRSVVVRIYQLDDIAPF